MLAAIFEAIFQVILEIVFEIIGEILSEVGLNIFERGREFRSVSSVFRAFTYLVVGTLLGILSYFVQPFHLVENMSLRIIGMILSPISMGLMLCFVSWFIYRRDRNEAFWSKEKFIQGVVFGVSYSYTRIIVVG